MMGLFKKSDGISEKKIKKSFPGIEKRFVIEIHREIASTNNRAKEIAASDDGRSYIIIAESQSGGRGRKEGRSFYSPTGGIYMTLLLHPNMRACESQKLTAFVAVAVAEAIEALSGADIKIKWVNDLYLGGKKLSGILTESAIAEDGGFKYLAVGIGINLRRSPLPEELQNVATSLEAECGQVVEREALIAEIAKRLLPLANGNIGDEFMTAYRSRSCVIGRKVRVCDETEEYTATDIDDDGNLIVVSDDGKTRSLNSGEVSIVTK